MNAYLKAQIEAALEPFAKIAELVGRNGGYQYDCLIRKLPGGEFLGHLGVGPKDFERARDALSQLRDPHNPPLIASEEVDEILSERNERIDGWMARCKELETELVQLRSAKDEPSEAETKLASALERIADLTRFDPKGVILYDIANEAHENWKARRRASRNARQS